MRAKEIRIYYAESETGHAVLIAKRIAVVTDPPILTDEFWRGSVVRIDREPDSSGTFPKITEVLFNPYPNQSYVRFQDDKDAWRLIHVFYVMGCDACVLIAPKDGEAGWIGVAHPDHVDPDALASALGVSQPDEGDEEVDEGGKEVDA